MGYKKTILDGHVILTLSVYTLLKQIENRKMFESLNLTEPESADSQEGDIWYNAIGSCMFWAICEDVAITEGSEDIPQLIQLAECWQRGKDADTETQWQLWQELLDNTVTGEIWEAVSKPDKRLLAPPLMQVTAAETKKKTNGTNSS